MADRQDDREQPQPLDFPGAEEPPPGRPDGDEEPGEGSEPDS